MTMRRLSMTGAVEDCANDQIQDGEESSTVLSGHSRDKSISDEGSQSSLVLAEEKKSSCEERPSKPGSSRRRRSLFGNVEKEREDSIERDDRHKADMSTSRRRRSLFGSSTSTLDTERGADSQLPKPDSRRRSFFASSNRSEASSLDIDDSSRSESTCSTRPPPSASSVARRRTQLGNSAPSLDETIGRHTPPRPFNGKGSGQSVTSESSHSTRKSYNSADTPPRITNRASDRSKSVDSPRKKQKDKVGRSNGLGASWSFHSNDSKMRGRRSSMTGSTDAEKSVIGDVPPSPGLLKGNGSRRRLSLSGLLGGSGNDNKSIADMVPPPSPTTTPHQQSSRRRLSLNGLLGGSGNDNKSIADSVPPSPTTNSHQKTSRRRLSLSCILGGGGGGNDDDNDPQDGDTNGTPRTQESERHASVTGAVISSPSESSSTTNNNNTKNRSRRPNRSSSNAGSGPPPAASAGPAPVVNPYELVNKARTKKGLPEFARNMLMDTLAKQVALELAASNGAKCTPTSYHGNVGQGDSIEKIHKTMMKQSQGAGVARGNILAMHFYEIGIGIARSKEGIIYICQLFK